MVSSHHLGRVRVPEENGPCCPVFRILDWTEHLEVGTLGLDHNSGLFDWDVYGRGLFFHLMEPFHLFGLPGARLLLDNGPLKN